MHHRSRVTAAAATVLASSVFAASAMAAPATGETVATGGLIGVDLVDVSADGRYVLTENSYAQIAKTLILVDRVTGESEPVLFDDAHTKALGTNTHYRGLDVSDDGNLILIGRYDRQYGEIDRLFVYNRNEKTNTTVGTLPSGDAIYALFGLARFTGGGTGVIYGAKDAAGKATTYRRTSFTAPATAIVDAIPASATRRGDVITWHRPLVPATAPVGNRGLSWPATRGDTPTYRPAIATGYTVVGEASKVIDRTKIVENAGAPEPYCIDGGVTAVTTTPAIPHVDDYGHAIRVGPSTVFDERFPSGPKFDEYRVNDVSEDGLRTLAVGSRFGYPYTWLRITDEPGATGLPVLPELRGIPEVTTSAAKFFAHGTGIVRHEYETAIPGSGKVVAYGEVGAGTPPVAKLPAPVPGATDNSPSLQPDVTWDACEAETKPPTSLAPWWMYFPTQLATPVRASKSAGTVFVKLSPSPSFRSVPQVTIKVQTLGFTTWSRTVRSDQTVTLPKPWWFLPQSVVIASKVAADPATGAPAAQVQRSYRWQAFR